MSIRTLKPSQLRLIHEVAQQGQLQLAADALTMTQPAASRMLAEAERQIGAPLFTRQPKGMEPTEIGASVLRRARVILRELASMESDVRALRGGLAGSVRVGAVTGPAISHLVSSIRQIKQQSPQADITAEVMPSRELLSQLSAGAMDFVLGRLLPDFDSDSFNILPMSGETAVLMVRADHPLARARVVTLTELVGQEWIMQQRGYPIREAVAAAFADVGLAAPRNVVNSPSLLLTIAYLAQTDAVTAVSQEVADLMIHPPVKARLTVIPTPRPIRVPPYFLLDLKRRPLSPLARQLCDAVAQMSQSPITTAGLL